MPLGFTNAYIYTVGGSTYDLRNVISVEDWKSPDTTNVAVILSTAPGQPIIFPRASFEIAYQACLNAMAAGGGGGGGGSITDGDKGDVTVTGSGSVWTVDTINGVNPYARRAVADVNTTVVGSDHLVSYTSITAPRVVTLPAGTVCKVGQEIVITDESNAASNTNTITIASSGGQLIDGAATEVIKAAGGMRRLFYTGSGWTFDKGVARVGNNLSDMADIPTSRTNLNVYSKQETFLQALIFG